MKILVFVANEANDLVLFISSFHDHFEVNLVTTLLLYQLLT